MAQNAIFPYCLTDIYQYPSSKTFMRPLAFIFFNNELLNMVTSIPGFWTREYNENITEVFAFYENPVTRWLKLLYFLTVSLTFINILLAKHL